MRIDLHVHSACSPCSSMDLSEILGHARSKGLDGVCITDHDTTDSLAQIREGFQPDGLLVLVGMEYTTDQGDYLVYGDLSDLPSGLDAVSLFSCMKDLGGAVVSAHPCRVWRPADAVVFDSGLCHLMEVENGRNSLEENEHAHTLARLHHMTEVAGSDAHRLNELGARPTEFSVPVRTMSDLVSALNQGHCRPAHASRVAV